MIKRSFLKWCLGEISIWEPPLWFMKREKYREQLQVISWKSNCKGFHFCFHWRASHSFDFQQDECHSPLLYNTAVSVMFASLFVGITLMIYQHFWFPITPKNPVSLKWKEITYLQQLGMWFTGHCTLQGCTVCAIEGIWGWIRSRELYISIEKCSF